MKYNLDPNLTKTYTALASCCLWRNQSGKVTVMSDFDYDAKATRFGAFWTLALTEGVENGNWSLEAHIDGELAGTHAFQIQNAAKPAETALSRKMLTPAQLYEHA